MKSYLLNMRKLAILCCMATLSGSTCAHSCNFPERLEGEQRARWEEAETAHLTWNEKQFTRERALAAIDRMQRAIAASDETIVHWWPNQRTIINGYVLLSRYRQARSQSDGDEAVIYLEHFCEFLKEVRVSE